MDEKNKGAKDDFLDGLEATGSDPFEPATTDDLFPDDAAQEATVAEEPVIADEKPLPFYKDPKVQRYIDKQLEKRLKDMKPSAIETFKQEVSTGDPSLVSAFEAIIGNDTPEKQAALKALEKSLSTVDERATKKAVERLQEVQKEQAEAEQKELEDAENEIEEGFEEIESHYGINLNDRQKEEYKKFLLKVEPKGGYVEYPDFIETFEVFKNYVKANRPSNSQAKALASRGMERSTSAQPAAKLERQGTKSLWQVIENMTNK